MNEKRLDSNFYSDEDDKGSTLKEKNSKNIVNHTDDRVYKTSLDSKIHNQTDDLQKESFEFSDEAIGVARMNEKRLDSNFYSDEDDKGSTLKEKNSKNIVNNTDSMEGYDLVMDIDILKTSKGKLKKIDKKDKIKENYLELNDMPGDDMMKYESTIKNYYEYEFDIIPKDYGKLKTARSSDKTHENILDSQETQKNKTDISEEMIDNKRLINTLKNVEIPLDKDKQSLQKVKKDKKKDSTEVLKGGLEKINLNVKTLVDNKGESVDDKAYHSGSENAFQNAQLMISGNLESSKMEGKKKSLQNHQDQSGRKLEADSEHKGDDNMTQSTSIAIPLSPVSESSSIAQESKGKTINQTAASKEISSNIQTKKQGEKGHNSHWYAEALSKELESKTFEISAENVDISLDTKTVEITAESIEHAQELNDNNKVKKKDSSGTRHGIHNPMEDDTHFQEEAEKEPSKHYIDSSDLMKNPYKRSKAQNDAEQHVSRSIEKELSSITVNERDQGSNISDLKHHGEEGDHTTAKVEEELDKENRLSSKILEERQSIKVKNNTQRKTKAKNKAGRPHFENDLDNQKSTKSTDHIGNDQLKEYEYETDLDKDLHDEYMNNVVTAESELGEELNLHENTKSKGFDENQSKDNIDTESKKYSKSNQLHPLSKAKHIKSSQYEYETELEKNLHQKNSLPNKSSLELVDTQINKGSEKINTTGNGRPNKLIDKSKETKHHGHDIENTAYKYEYETEIEKEHSKNNISSSKMFGEENSKQTKHNNTKKSTNKADTGLNSEHYLNEAVRENPFEYEYEYEKEFEYEGIEPNLHHEKALTTIDGASKTRNKTAQNNSGIEKIQQNDFEFGNEQNKTEEKDRGLVVKLDQEKIRKHSVTNKQQAKGIQKESKTTQLEENWPSIEEKHNSSQYEYEYEPIELDAVKDSTQVHKNQHAPGKKSIKNSFENEHASYSLEFTKAYDTKGNASHNVSLSESSGEEHKVLYNADFYEIFELPGHQSNTYDNIVKAEEFDKGKSKDTHGEFRKSKLTKNESKLDTDISSTSDEYSYEYEPLLAKITSRENITFTSKGNKIDVMNYKDLDAYKEKSVKNAREDTGIESEENLTGKTNQGSILEIEDFDLITHSQEIDFEENSSGAETQLKHAVDENNIEYDHENFPNLYSNEFQDEKEVMTTKKKDKPSANLQGKKADGMMINQHSNASGDEGEGTLSKSVALQINISNADMGDNLHSIEYSKAASTKEKVKNDSSINQESRIQRENYKKEISD